MNDPTHTPPHDPRRLTGVPEIDGTAPTQIIVDGHELTVDQAKAPEPFKLTTQVGTVDLVLLDNEGEPHKIGEAEVVQGHITAHIDDDDAVRYLSGGTITLDRLDLLAEHSYPVEPILVHAPEGQIRVGHTCDMPGGLQITITDRAMRGPMMAALAEIKTAALEGRAPLEHNVAGGFTPRTEVSEVGPAHFDNPDGIEHTYTSPAAQAAGLFGSDRIAAAIEWCCVNAGRGLAAELAQDAARELREKWAARVQNRVRCEPLAYAISTALHIGAETAIAWAEGEDRRLRRAPDPSAAPAAKVAGCTGDVPPGAEAVESRFVELFYLDGPRMGLRFEGLPDIYVPDLDAHRLAIAVATGNADLETLRYEPGPNGYDLPRTITLELSHAAEGHEDEAYKPELHVALRHLVAAIARTKVLERSLEAYKRARSVVDQGQERIDALINGPALRGRNEGIAWADEASHFSGPRLLLGVADRDLEKGDTAYLPIIHKHEPVGDIGRRLMTEDDFRTPVEFKLYCIGAETLPQGILPGSWEAHLLKAMAAMASAAVGLRMGSMEAPQPNDLALRLDDAAKRGRHLWSQGGSTETIRAYVCEASNLLDAAAEKYSILAALQRGTKHRDPAREAADDISPELLAFRQWGERKVGGAEAAFMTGKELRDAIDRSLRDDLDTLRRDAGGKGWLNDLAQVDAARHSRDLLMLALEQGAEARRDLATIARARPSKSLQRVTLDGEVFMLPGDIAAEFLAADDRSPERTLIAVRGAAAMQGRILELEAGIGLAQDELDGAAEEDSLDRRDQAMREANRQLARVR